jgi:hypothetical protein
MALLHEEDYYTADDKFCIRFRTSKMHGSLRSQLLTEVMVLQKVEDGSNNYVLSNKPDLKRDLLVTRAGRVTKEMIQKHRDFIIGCHSKILDEFTQTQKIA